MQPAAAPAPAVSADDRFHFDAQGFLHLRGVLTADEVADALAWGRAAAARDPRELNADRLELMRHHLARPVSRIIDADHRCLRFLDHPRIAPYLVEFLGEDYKHVDNDFYDTAPGYAGGGWHRGVAPHATGYVADGRFACPMVKVFFCLTDVGPGQGPFVVVPGSHKAQVPIPTDRLDLPGQRIFDDVRAGDAIVFNEALLHNGRPNTTDRTRTTLILNFGDPTARCWIGYHPSAATRAAATERQRRILANPPGDWAAPHVPGMLPF